MSSNTNQPVETASEYSETEWRNHLRPSSGSEDDSGQSHVGDDEDEITIKVSVAEKKVKVVKSAYIVAHSAQLIRSEAMEANQDDETDVAQSSSSLDDLAVGRHESSIPIFKKRKADDALLRATSSRTKNIHRSELDSSALVSSSAHISPHSADSAKEPLETNAYDGEEDDRSEKDERWAVHKKPEEKEIKTTSPAPVDSD